MWTNINAPSSSSNNVFTLYIIQTGYHAGSPSTPALEYFVNITSTTNSPVTHEHMEGWDGGSDGRRKRRCNGAIGSSCDRAAGVIVFLGLPTTVSVCVSVSVTVSLSLSRFSTLSLLCQSLKHFDTHQQTCIFHCYQFSLFSLHLKSNFPSCVCEWSHGPLQSDEVVPLPACQSSHMLHRHTKPAVASCLTSRRCQILKRAFFTCENQFLDIIFHMNKTQQSNLILNVWCQHLSQAHTRIKLPHLKHCY